MNAGQDLPRRGYFQAADRAPLEQPGTTQQRADQGRTASTRQQLALSLTTAAEAVANAVKAARAFDATGHLPAALPHLAAAVADLNNAHAALVDSITSYAERLDRRERMNRGLAIAAQLEAEQPGTAAPKPGPDAYRVHRNYPG